MPRITHQSKLRALTQSGTLLIAVLIGTCLVVARDYIVPARFSSDARLVQDLIDQGDLSNTEGSFSRLAQVYQFLGAGSNQEAAGLITFGSFVIVTLLTMNRLSQLSIVSRNISILAAGTLLLASVFLGTYSKELITVVVVAAVIFLPAGWLGESILTVVMLLYGLTFRQYWILVAVAYIVLRLSMRRHISRRTLFLICLATLIALGLAVYVYTGVSADYFRNTVNASAARATTETIIVPYFTGAEPIAGVVNVTITWLALLVPIPLFLKMEPYYLVTGLLLAILTVIAVRGMRWMLEPRNPDQAFMARVTAALVAYSIVQALFEPDYGSYLRHLAVMLPLLLILAGTGRRLTRSVDEGLSVSKI